MSTSMLDAVPPPLDAEELHGVDAWWRAANYLAVGQIYLLANPLLREPLRAEHVKPRLLGHFGTVPGLNLVWAHANRLIRQRDLNAVFVAGPGHGGPGPNACAWLEGTYSELYSHVPADAEGLTTFFRQFSFPGGVPSHCAPETPGSLHEGGELGYSLLHAFGAVLDDPDLVAICVVGDGEAETGPLATSWHCGKFLDPARDGAVLPVLALNGYKIANPTLLARIPEADLLNLLRGYGYEPQVVDGDEPEVVHQAMAAAMASALDQIAEVQGEARAGARVMAPRWPMIVLRTPKGWTCPPTVDGLAVEGTFRSHQVPVPDARADEGHRELLATWLASYRPEELFDTEGRLVPELARLAPVGHRRMSANPVANGGRELVDLRLPDWRERAVPVERPGATGHSATQVLGTWLRDVTELNPTRFITFAPDELASNRLQDVLEVARRSWPDDMTTDQADAGDGTAPEGRVIEVLSEHICQGLLEGYLLTGRHGVFTCYEAFIHIVDAMFNQHAKWLQASAQVPWRVPLASLNYLLSSHVWRQDHNGFTHQDPGFLDVVMNKSPEIVRVYLPPDANTLLCTYDHCLRSRHLVNVVVAGKQPQADWLSPAAAEDHCARGVGIWEWAGSEDGSGTLPDVVLTCAGDVPTLETLAAVSILRTHLPDLAVRVVNVVDLMRLQPESEHPHGLTDREFDTIFTEDRPVIFAFHGYPWLIHRLTYRRHNHAQLHVRGYKEMGTTTTPFDMVMLNDLDRYHLVIDVIDRVPGLRSRAAVLRQQMEDARLQARRWTREHGEDLPEITEWRWSD